MKLITFKRDVNTGLINKQMIIDQTPTPVQFSTDEVDGEILKPILDPDGVKEMVAKSQTLFDCIEATADDMMLRDIVFSEDNEVLTKFYNKKNKLELKNAAKDWCQYGYGCVELVYDEDKKTLVKLAQIPADTCRIIRKEIPGEENKYSYYVINTGRNDKNKKQQFRLSQFEYTQDDIDQYGEVLWFGGGADSQFYDTPVFFSNYHNVLLDVAIVTLESENITNGNLISAIMTVSGNVNDEFEQQLEEAINDTGTGVLNLIIRPNSVATDQVPEVKMHKLDRDDGNTLEKKQDRAQAMIMQAFKMPEIRLGRMNNNESMNSEKSRIVWQIYTSTIAKKQMIFEIFLDDFNRDKLGIDAEIDIQTPIFVDDTATKIANVFTASHLGMITYEEGNIGLAKLMPEVEIDLEKVAQDPLMKQRIYKGQLLGQSDKSNESEVLNSLDDNLESIENSYDIMRGIRANLR